MKRMLTGLMCLALVLASGNGTLVQACGGGDHGNMDHSYMHGNMGYGNTGYDHMGRGHSGSSHMVYSQNPGSGYQGNNPGWQGYPSPDPRSAGSQAAGNAPGSHVH